MSKQDFTLLPFDTKGAPLNLKISGSIGRHGRMLSLVYVLSGDLVEIIIPGPAARPLRKDRLWDETCFEFFFAPAASGRYWEGNLSPAGHWNIYRFKEYRREMQEEKAITDLPFTVYRQQEALKLDLELDLGRIVAPDAGLRLGISAVIKSTDGNITFWALVHRGDRPDFHRSTSFIITL